MKQYTSKRPIFYIIAVILPFALLLVAELLLRAAGFAQDIPLFIESEELSGYSQPNPNLIHRYFAAPEFAPNVSPDTVFFKTEKPNDTFRIVIQGGSTAAGFPYGRFGSLQGMLEQRFKRTYPTKKIEIINTAMASVNSYTLLDIADEIIAIEPDVVLVYAGHNEFLGVMGVGSNYAAKGGRAATLLFLKLKELALYQAVQQVYVSWFTPSPESKESDSRSLMAKVAAGKKIPLDSDLYQQGLAQFEGNLSLLLEQYKQADIPVFLGNLVRNEKDLAPFSSIAEFDWQNFNQKLQYDAFTAYTPTPVSEAQAYQQGKIALALGQQEQAKELLNQAADLDLLRFRAPSKFNDIIAELARANDVTLVDVEQQFRADSDDSLIGAKHMLEHVHPTKRGYFVLAEAFYQAMVSSDLLGKEQQAFSADNAWLEVPVTELAERYADLKIAQLTSDFPFRTTKAEVAPPPRETELDKLFIKRLSGASWIPLQHELMFYYEQKKQYADAALVAGIISDALPNSDVAANNSARLYRFAEDYAMSNYYQLKSLAIVPNEPNYLMSYAHNLFLQKKYQQSIDVLTRAKEHGARDSAVTFYLNKVKTDLRRSESARNKTR